MKKYVAIGHFKYDSNMRSIAIAQNSMKEFRTDLAGNEFCAWVVLTEKRFEKLQNMDESEIYEEVKKMTSNYRRWNDVTDYIYQCRDIIEERLANAC